MPNRKRHVDYYADRLEQADEVPLGVLAGRLLTVLKTGHDTDSYADLMKQIEFKLAKTKKFCERIVLESKNDALVHRAERWLKDLKKGTGKSLIIMGLRLDELLSEAEEICEAMLEYSGLPN